MRTPDIMVTETDDTVIIEPQTNRAVQWLRQAGGLGVEDPHDKIRLDLREWRLLVASLTTAGLTIWVDS